MMLAPRTNSDGARCAKFGLSGQLCIKHARRIYLPSMLGMRGGNVSPNQPNVPTDVSEKYERLQHFRAAFPFRAVRPSTGFSCKSGNGSDVY